MEQTTNLDRNISCGKFTICCDTNIGEDGAVVQCLALLPYTSTFTHQRAAAVMHGAVEESRYEFTVEPKGLCEKSMCKCFCRLVLVCFVV